MFISEIHKDTLLKTDLSRFSFQKFSDSFKAGVQRLEGGE